MRRNKALKNLQKNIVLLCVLALSACVEIKSDAKVSADAKVQFTTTYDLSKVVSALNVSNQANVEDLAKSLSCEKMNEKMTEGFTCKDLGAAKFSITGSFKGDESNGVTLNDENKVLVDAVKLFKKTADLNSENTESADLADKIIQKGLVPVAIDQAAQYKQMGVVLMLQIALPYSVLSVDGVETKEVTDNVVTVNFVDVAGKEHYVIVGDAGRSNAWWKIIFALCALSVLILAGYSFLKSNKKN